MRASVAKLGNNFTSSPSEGGVGILPPFKTQVKRLMCDDVKRRVADELVRFHKTDSHVPLEMAISPRGNNNRKVSSAWVTFTLPLDSRRRSRPKCLLLGFYIASTR